MALGNETAGIVGNNEELIEKIISCGKKCRRDVLAPAFAAGNAKEAI